MTPEQLRRISSFRRLLERLAKLRRPFVVVLAGPNGAGKSTFHRNFLATTALPFVNADEIAAGLGPGEADTVALKAAEQADRLREAHVAARESFVFETVFSDSGGRKVEFLSRAQQVGYVVFLVFIGLDSVALSEARVVHRVRAGGHDVPSQRLVERFPRVLANLVRALPFVELVWLFDNSHAANPHRFVASYRRGRLIRSVTDLPRWARSLPGLG